MYRVKRCSHGREITVETKSNRISKRSHTRSSVSTFSSHVPSTVAYSRGSLSMETPDMSETSSKRSSIHCAR